jgi:ATP-dependent protease ClpP protease subunit
MKTIYLKGDIGWEITAEKIRQMIDIKSTEKLQVIINSPGGFVFEAFEIFDIFEQYKGQIEMVIMPYAASAASYIVMAGDKIRAFKNSVWMAHRVQSIAIGDADEMQKEANIMQALEDIVIEAYQRKIKVDKPKMKEMMKAEIWLIGWEQLTEAGLIDDVIDSIGDIDIPEEDKLEIEKSTKETETNAINMLKMRIAKTETRMRNENEKIKNSYERIAAKFEINPVITPVENNSKEDNKMVKLDELLKANPEAKAEHDSILESAKGEGKAELAKAQAALGEDRKRIAKILQVAKAELLPETVAAIESDMQPGDFAIAMIAKQKELGDKAAEKQSPFAALVSKQTPKDQTKNAIEDMKAELTEVDKKIEVAVKNSIPKKGVK